MASSSKKKPVSYADAHNKAVNYYKKSCKVLIWVGILNVFSAILGVFNLGSSANNANGINYRYSICLSFNRFVFDALEYSNLNVVVVDLLIIAISMSSAALLAYLGVLASQGKKVYLFSAAGIYLLDFVAMFVYDNLLGGLFEKEFSQTTYMFSLFTHIIVLFFIGLAVFEYYNVINIEKQHIKNLNTEKESK